MHKLLTLLVFTLLFRSVAPQETGEAEPSPTIMGVVVDPEGKPVPGATVVASLPVARVRRLVEPVKTHTDNSGHFSLPVEDASAFQVLVVASGFAFHTEDDVRPGRELRIVLDSGAVLEGIVLDARSRSPVPGATVETSSARVQVIAPRDEPRLFVSETVTDERGRFRLTGLPSSVRSVSASAPGYGRAQVRAMPGERTQIFLRPGIGIYGRVVTVDGDALAGAYVEAMKFDEFGSWTASSISDETGEDGSFSLLGIERARYRVLAHHPDHSFATIDVPAAEGADVILEDLALSTGAPVTGRLMNDDGEPLSGDVRIESINGERPPWSLFSRLNTKAAPDDGAFVLPHVPAGEYRVLVEALGYAAQRIELSVDPDSDGHDVGDISFEDGFSVMGYVVDEMGDAVAGARVYSATTRSFIAGVVQGPMSVGSAETDENGFFRIRGLEAATYKLSAIAPGYIAAVETSVEAGVSDVVIQLEKGGSITGYVVDTDGQPISSFSVMVEPHPRRSVQTNRFREFSDAPDGRFEIDELGEATYVLTFNAHRMKPTRLTRIELGTGSSTDAGVVTMRVGGVIRGAVIDADGNSVAGASLSAAPGPLMSGVTSDATGKFELRGLEAGVIDVRASHPDFADAVARDVELESESDPVAIRLTLTRGGRLEGVVRERSGVGIPGRVVQLTRRSTRPSSTTDDAGTFFFERLSPGSYRVQLRSADGGMSATLQEQEVEIVEETTSHIVFESRTVRVLGQVTRSGAAIGGAHISMRPAGARGGFGLWSGAEQTIDGPLYLNAMSGPDGFFELLVDRPGEYTVDATGSDGTSRFPRKTIVIPDVDAHTVNLEFGTATVTGRVVSKNDEPIERARVTVYPSIVTPVAQSVASAATDASGRFKLEVEAGDYLVRTRAEAFAPEEDKLEVSDGQPIELTIRLSRGSRIFGRVLDAQGHYPGRYYVHAVEDARPTTDPPRLSAWADIHPDGTFELTNLSSETGYNLLAGSDLLGFTFVSGVRPGQELTLSLRPAAWLVVVVRAADGRVAPDARIVVSAIGGRKVRGVSGRTDAQGRVELYVPAGQLELKAVQGDANVGSARISVREGERASADVVLQRAR